MGLGYVFSVFSSDPVRQLIFLFPFLFAGVGLLIVPMQVMLKRKYGRKLLGGVLLTTIGFYLAFIIMHLSLPLTGTSYGASQPVIIVFAVVYLLLFDFGLLVLMLVTRSPRIMQRWRRLVVGYGLFQALVLGTLVYAFYFETQWLDVTQTEVTLAKLPPGTSPIKVALISDIHMERWTHRDYETIRQLETIKPDLLLIAGDHINIDYYEPETYDQLKRFFTALAPTARFGVYAVPGGVDGYDLPGLLEGTGVKLLDDTSAPVTINGVTFYLVGIRHHFAEVDYPALQEVQQGIPDGAIKILIYHPPDLAPEAAAEGFDFYFAGHTHGGQIALPFAGAIFTASKYGRKYSAGLYNLGGPANTQMYITRGLGMEGGNLPRARLFARPEISVITFKAK